MSSIPNTTCSEALGYVDAIQERWEFTKRDGVGISIGDEVFVLIRPFWRIFALNNCVILLQLCLHESRMVYQYMLVM